MLINLSFSGEDLQSSVHQQPSSYVVVHRATDHEVNVKQAMQEWIGRTETIKDNNQPSFTTQLEVASELGESQSCCALVYQENDPSAPITAAPAIDELIGGCLFHLPSVLAQPKTCLISSNGSRLTITATPCHSEENDVLQLQFSAKHLKRMELGFTSSFFTISRLLPESLSSDGSPRKRLLVTSATKKRSRNPTWKPVQISIYTMDGLDKKAPVIVFECFAQLKVGLKSLGSFTCSREQLTEGNGSEFELIRNRNKKGGIVWVSRVTVKEEPCFAELVSSHGLRLQLAVAVDYTSSNGNPGRRTSLHYTTPTKPNQYIRAMETVGDALKSFSGSSPIAVYGFGGIVTGFGGSRNDSFPLTFTESPDVGSVSEMVHSYNVSMERVRLSGPRTKAAPVIQTVVDRIKASGGESFSNEGIQSTLNYTILLILTDGEFSDLVKTIKTMISADTLPLSVIVLGIGNNCGFKRSKAYLGTGIPRTRNATARRDMVCFSSFKEEEKLDPEFIQTKIFPLIPRHVEQWFRLTRD